MKIKKYKTASGLKYQILSNQSCFKINGGNDEVNSKAYNDCMNEADKLIAENHYSYYIKEKYVKPNYGIIGVNLRIYNSNDAFVKELKKRKLI